MISKKELKFDSKKGSVCRICGAQFPKLIDKDLIMCGFCHQKAFVDSMFYMEHYVPNSKLKQPRVKFNVPKSTVEKRKWLAYVLNISQGDVDNLAVGVLYDIFTIMPGKIESTSKGITELVARIRLSIVEEGIRSQNKKIQSNFEDALTETVQTSPKARGEPIGGVTRGFKSRN